MFNRAWVPEAAGWMKARPPVYSHAFQDRTHRGVKKMTWETPTFVEVKMDAEINSYQDDFGDDRDTGV